MDPFASLTATVSCTKSSTSATIVGFIIIIAFIGAIVGLAIANGQARKRLGAATGELNYLRVENGRLQEWRAAGGGGPVGVQESGAYLSASSIPAQWYPDPSRRHEQRYWNGTAWTDDVSDNGVLTTDPAS
jgi:Protein of unknown function (DUF2510)